MTNDTPADRLTPMFSLFRRKPAFRPSPGRKLCILHAGMPKTGSSALQAFLSANAEDLAAHGILYPVAGRSREKRYDHGDLARAIAERVIFHGTDDYPQDLRRELAETPHDVVIVSAEFLFGPLYFNPSPRVPAFFRDLGYDITGVMYLRDQPDFLNSAYAQMTKSLREEASFDTYLARRFDPVRPMQDWALRIERLLDPALSEWGTHHFRPYDTALKRRGIEPDFLDLLLSLTAPRGLAPGFGAAEAAALKPVPRQNENCGPVQVEAGRRLARVFLAKADRKAVLRATVAMGDRLGATVDRMLGEEPAFTALTPARAEMIRDRLRPRNDDFALRLWNRSWADVFPPRPAEQLRSNDLADTADPAGLAAAERIVTAFLPEAERDFSRRLARNEGAAQK